MEPLLHISAGKCWFDPCSWSHPWVSVIKVTFNMWLVFRGKRMLLKCSSWIMWPSGSHKFCCSVHLGHSIWSNRAPPTGLRYIHYSYFILILRVQFSALPPYACSGRSLCLFYAVFYELLVDFQMWHFQKKRQYKIEPAPQKWNLTAKMFIVFFNKL